MPTVTISRTEYKSHTFEIPQGVEIGSEEYEDIVNSFEWDNATIKNVDEVIVNSNGFEE